MLCTLIMTNQSKCIKVYHFYPKKINYPQPSVLSLLFIQSLNGEIQNHVQGNYYDNISS